MTDPVLNQIWTSAAGHARELQQFGHLSSILLKSPFFLFDLIMFSMDFQGFGFTKFIDIRLYNII